MDAAEVQMVSDAEKAVAGLGWPRAIARAAVAEAVSSLGERPSTIDRLIFEALRRCPRPCA
jgi:hypothetical protein